jgi:putative chitinase
MQRLRVGADDWERIWPNAPSDVIAAFAAKGDVLAKAGVLDSRTRLAYFCANVEHECGGFTIRNLTENINYTPARMAAVWPNRFASASAVIRKYGAGAGWQLRAFDDIYGNRMGNRPGTHDGSTFIGRGGPQVTGRDGYREVGNRAGRDLVANPIDACRHDLQPEVCAAFWSWKGLNRFADAGDFVGGVKVWNGGTNGLADRRAQMAGNQPIIARLLLVGDAIDAANDLGGDHPLAKPVFNLTWTQEKLNELDRRGLLDLAAPLVVDGRYGMRTHGAVVAFQRKYGVAPVDGLAGPKTNGAIERLLAA